MGVPWGKGYFRTERRFGDLKGAAHLFFVVFYYLWGRGGGGEEEVAVGKGCCLEVDCSHFVSMYRK